jgi:hypothetical protein
MDIFPIGNTTNRYFGNLDVPDGGYVGNPNGLPLIIFDYSTEALQLGGTNITGAGSITATDLIITDCAVLGANSAVFQPSADSTTFFQVLDAAGAGILTLDSTNRQVTVEQSSTTYPFTVKSTDGTDSFSMWHDNTNAFFGWTDGSLTYQTQELNQDTIFRIEGNGTGKGQVQVFDAGGFVNTRVQAASNRGEIYVDGAGSTEMRLQTEGEVPWSFFVGSNEGVTQFVSVSGRRTGDSRRVLTMQVSADDNDTFMFDNVGNYEFRDGTFALRNTTHSDAAGTRNTALDWRGEQSGGERSTLARIEASHDGAADDEKGKLVLSTNDGSDSDTPTNALTIDSGQTVTLAQDLVMSGTVPIGIDMSGGTFATAVQNWPATPVIQANGTQIYKSDASNFNVLIGDDAFQNDNGQYNIGLGYQAGYYNDASGAGGDTNVYIGYKAGYGDSGPGTLNSGKENLGIGYLSLTSNTDGNSNFGLGATALRDNLGGDENVGIGFAALQRNTTGSFNVGIGTSAIKANTAGTRSVGIGSESLSAITSSINNVAIGYQSGQGTASAVRDSVFIGYQAGHSIDGGDDNVFIGCKSGDIFTSGGSNVMLGNEVGSTANGIISAATESNPLAIGNQDPATNLPLIEGYFAAHASGPKLFINAEAIDAHNATHEDADESREVVFTFTGERSGGERVEHVQLEGHHDGAADDDAGEFVIRTSTAGGVLTDALKIDSSQITYIGDAGTTDYTKIEADGTLEFNGTATVWNDIQFEISSGVKGVANQPSWSTFTTNTSEYQFAVNDYIDLNSEELAHSWKEGTAGDFHLHVALDAANSTGSSRYAKFTLYIAYINSSSIWTETSLTAELEIPDGSASLQAFYHDMGNVSFTGLSIGTQVKCRITRITATGGTEYADEIFINQVGCHLEEDTVGSRTETAK